jgi:outer membrane protein
MLKIEATRSSDVEVTYRLSGALTGESLPTLRSLLAESTGSGRAVTLDLGELTRVDRECVDFLVRGPGRDARFENCPAYLSDWVRAEKRSPMPRAAGRSLRLAFAALLGAGALTGQTLTLSLREAVGLALADGTAARIATERVETASAQSRQARSFLLPQVAGGIEGANESINFATYGFPTAPGQSPVVGPFNVLDFHVSAAMQIVDLAARRRYEAARQGVVVTDVERRRTENEVAAAVATLYVSLQRAEASVETARANVDLFTKLRDFADDRRKAGVATRVDSTRAEVALVRQRQALLVAENQRDTARLALLHAIGADQASGLTLADALGGRDEPAPAVQAALGRAIAERPELASIAARIQAEGLSIAAEMAERLPTFSAQFQGGYNGNRIGELSWNRQIVGLIAVPIFTGGRIKARVAEAESQQRELGLQKTEVERQVEEEVRRAILAYESARSRTRVAAENVMLAEQELDLAQDRFANGVTTSIEVDNAQTSLVTAQDDRIAAAADQERARYDLWRATGQIRELIPEARS